MAAQLTLNPTQKWSGGKMQVLEGLTLSKELHLNLAKANDREPSHRKVEAKAAPEVAREQNQIRDHIAELVWARSLPLWRVPWTIVG